MNDAPHIDFHTHWYGCERYHEVPRDELIVGQSLFFPHETPHPRADYASMGIHPMQKDAGQLLEQLRNDREAFVNSWEERIEKSKVPIRAIGECGWDKRSSLPTGEQTELVSAQIALSRELELPMIWHIVGGWHHLLAMRKEQPEDSPVWIVHGFRGRPELRKQLIAAGITLSYHPLYDHWQSHQPEDATLLETDEVEMDIREVYTRVAHQLEIPTTELRDRAYEQWTNVLHNPKGR